MAIGPRVASSVSERKPRDKGGRAGEGARIRYFAGRSLCVGSEHSSVRDSGTERRADVKEARRGPSDRNGRCCSELARGTFVQLPNYGRRPV
jgi:hypothetical protein